MVTLCYTRHETAPGTHADIPHEHERHDMSESHHYDRAKSRLHNGTTNEVARAQAEATLALAYEQRTANLIEWAGGVYTPELREVIRERLGLA